MGARGLCPTAKSRRLHCPLIARRSELSQRFRRASAGPENIRLSRTQVCSVGPLARQELHAARDLEQRRYFGGVATVNRCRSSLVIAGVQDDFEFAIAIEIENRGHVVIITRIKMFRIRMNFTREDLGLKFSVYYAPQ